MSHVTLNSLPRIAWTTGVSSRQRIHPAVLLAALGLLLTNKPLQADRPFVFHHEQIVGTALELQVATTSETHARKVEKLALAEINRLDAILSTYRPDSQFSKWLASQGTPERVAPEIVTVLRRFDHWREQTRGALNPAVGALERVWQHAEQCGSLPGVDELSAACHTLRGPHWRILPGQDRIEHLTTCPLTLNALAKGFVLDRVCEVVATSGLSVEGFLVNLGGDLRVQGRLDARVAIADPRQDADNGIPLRRIVVRDRSVATSGNYRRGYEIAGRHYSHILDPATGQPVDHVLSATIVANDAMDADALATALSILAPDQGLALVEQLPEAACLLVLADGSQRTSSRWPSLEPHDLQLTAVAAQVAETSEDGGAQEGGDQDTGAPSVAGATDATKDASAGDTASGDTPAPMELVVQLEINRAGGGGYRRPYIAVWIEDKDDLSVRTLALWLQKEAPGPRWHRDLRRWYRADQERQLVDTTDLIETISAATRPPGKYKIVWDGKDDADKPVPAGKYRLLVEAAREHGTYQLMQHELVLDGKPFEFTMDGNVEIKSATAQYRATAGSR